MTANWYLDTYGTYLRAIEQHLHALCSTAPDVAPLYRQMVWHHFAWDVNDVTSNDFDLTLINGKRSRPLMTLLVADAICGAHDRAMSAAAAVELVHNFTLVHDDVMDVSDTRRGRITVWKKWNISQAINAGDGMYTWAIRALTTIAPNKIADAVAVLMDACLATVQGQVLDIGFEERMDVTADEYLVMIYNKSGALIEGSARLGALLSTDDTATVDAYGEFAKNLGIAFQIQDDYLGVWGDEALTGKSATSDIEGKKKSFPVLIALDEATEADKATLTTIYEKDVLSKADVQTVLDILDKVDAKERTHQLTNEFYEKSLAALNSVPTGDKNHDGLLGLANFLIKRDY